jgi:hypothetical protein
MNTKLRALLVIALMLAGFAASAQYTGGNGRGDHMGESGISPLGGFDAMFSGGSGRGDHMALGSGMQILSCTNPTDGGTIAASQIICYNASAAAFTSTALPTGHTGTLEYQWQMSTVSPTFVDISGAVSSTYTPVGTITQTTWFRRMAKVTCETSWLASNSIEITVIEPSKRYVTVSGAGSKNGLNWANAYDGTQLQSAINESCVNEVWVAEGHYMPTTGIDRTKSFIMKNGLAIYGGFSGEETNLNERNWKINVTILSGDLMNNDGVDFANNGDNSYHVVCNTNNGLDSSAILDGFTISGGNADGETPHDFGAGMCNYNSSPSITNCIFSSNSADYYGGGLDNQFSSPSLINCIFTGNRSTFGGGMKNLESNPNLTNCTFYSNSAAMNGGGMDNNSSSPVLTNCTFSANIAASEGGGIINFSTSNPTITNCIVWGNEPDGVFNYSENVPIINYSIIQGSSIYEGTGNLLADPKFVNSANPAGPDGKFGTADDGISIYLSSPAVNKGNSETASPTTDITGYTRTGVFDMGAYEGQFDCINPTNGGTVAGNQTICYNASAAAFTSTSLPTGHSGTLQYQWQMSTVSPTFVDISGAVSSTFTPVGTITQTTWFRRMAKVTCEEDWVASNTIEVTVNPLRLYVTVSGAGTMDGGSWENALMAISCRLLSTPSALPRCGLPQALTNPTPNTEVQDLATKLI